MPLNLIERNGFWYASGTVGRQRVRRSLGTRDRAQAEEARAQLEARLWKRHTYGDGAVRTFEEAVTSYVKQGGEARFLEPLLRHFKGRAIGSIRPGELREAALTLYPKAGPATRNRQAIVPCRAVINAAAELGWCAPIRARLFDVPKSRKHMPADRAWLDAFLTQADRDGLQHLSAMVLFMHQTGARRGEALRLRGEHVDLAQRIAVLERTKTDQWSVRHLTGELVVRLSALSLAPEAPVFGYTDGRAVNRRIAAVCGRAGIEAKTTHAAGRHSFGTNAMAAGARVKDAMDAGGWKSARLFLETYVHSQDAGREIARKFDAEAGPAVTNPAHAPKKRRYRFGKKG